MVKIFLRKFLWIFFAFLFFSKTIPGYALDEVKTIRIGVYDNSPKVYLNGAGIASGLFPDILNYIAKQENWRLEYIFGTWEDGLDRLSRGEIDIMVDTAISEERQKLFNFNNETVFNSWGVIFVRKNSPINSFRDLNGKKIAVLKSSIYYGGPEGIDWYLQSFGFAAEYTLVSKQADVFNLLENGEVDAAVVSRVFALTNQNKFPDIESTDLFFSPTELRFAFYKGGVDNQYLIEKIDYWLKEFKNGHNQTYQQLLTKNGLAEIGNVPAAPWWASLTWFIILILIVIIFLSVISRLVHFRNIISKELKESRELDKALLQAANRAGIGITILQDAEDKQGAIIFANDHACAISGYSRKEALTKSIKDVFPPKDIQEILTRYKNRQLGKPVPFSYESTIVCKDGSETPVLLSLATMEFRGKIATVAYFRDMTENKRTINAIQEARHRLKYITDFLPDATMVIDNQKKVILWNKAIEKMTGIKEKDMLGKGNFEYTIPFYGTRRLSLTDLLWEKNSEIIKKYTNVNIEGEDSLSALAFCNALYNGKGAYVFAKVSRLRDKDGNMIGAIESIRDITKSKLAEDALQQSEQRFRKIFEEGPLGMVTVGKDMRFLSANPSFCKMLGYSLKELKRLTIFDLTHPDYQKELEEAAKKLLAGKITKFQTEKICIKKNKSFIWIAITSVVVRDDKNQFMYLLIMLNDITERKKFDEEIKKHSQKLETAQKALVNVMDDLNMEKNNLEKEKSQNESILLSIGEGLFVTDLNGKIILINKAFENLLGYKPREVIGKKFTDVIFARDKDGNPILAENRPLMVALRTKREVISPPNPNFYLIRKDGSVFPIAYRVTFFTSGKKIIGAIGIFHDISKEKEIDQMKSDFLSVAAHQLRTPLGAMRWSMEMLLGGDMGVIPRLVKKTLSQIYGNNLRLIALVNDLLNVSRIEQGKTSSNPSLVNVNSVIRKTVEEIKAIADQRGVIFKLKLKKNTPSIFVDPEHFHHVVENLLSNGVKYNIYGGKIEVKVSSANNKINIAVSNTGKPIAKADQSKLFLKFFRSSDAIKSETSGSGLGLFLIKSYIEEWKGKIWFKSPIPGKKDGTIFYIELPITLNLKNKNK